MGQPRLTVHGWRSQQTGRRAGAALGLVLGLLAPAQAQPQSFSCPLRLASQEAAVAEIAGAAFKQSFLPTSLSYLIGVSLLESARTDSPEIAPSVSGSQWQWNLEGVKRGAVLACRYEGGILLARNLAPGLRECVASVQRSGARGVDGYGLSQAAVSCR